MPPTLLYHLCLILVNICLCILYYLFFSELDKEITTEFCFDAMFVYSLLTVGLGINETSWSNVVFSDEVCGLKFVFLILSKLMRTS